MNCSARTTALAALLIVSATVSCTCEPSKTGSFDSRTITDRAERLAIVHRYLRPVTPVEDAVFDLWYQDNSFLIPAPSDGEFRVVLRVAREHVPAWTSTYRSQLRPWRKDDGAPDLAWAFELLADSSWAAPRETPTVYAARDGSYRAVYEADGLVVIQESIH